MYTGNDDNILNDLLTPFDFCAQQIRIVGGLLGHWAVWAKTAVSHLDLAKNHGNALPREMLTLAAQITDANAALFDPAHQFRGCIPGIHGSCVAKVYLKGGGVLIPRGTLRWPDGRN